MIYLILFYEFFKIGLFAIGGGLVTVPFLFDLAEVYPWFDAKDLADMIAISESTPGPLGVNMATYAGFKAAGVGGAIVATLGLVTPSVIIIMLISKLLKKFRNNIWVDSVLSGIRPAVIALILFAGLEVAKLTIIDWKTFLMFALFWCAIHFYKRSPIFYIVISAVIGIVFQL